MDQFRIIPQEGLDELLPFERLLTEISTLFINLPADQIDNEINSAQSRICELLDLDRSTLWVTADNDPGLVVLTHIHQPPEIPPPPERMSARDFFPYTAHKVLSGETFAISSMTELPAEAVRDRESFSRFRTKSAVFVPLSIGKGPVFGVLSFAITREERCWRKRVVQQFELIAQIFANALSRKQAERSLQERLRFDMLLTEISTLFITLPADQIDNEIAAAQKRICELLDLDRSTLWITSEDDPGMLLLARINQQTPVTPSIPEQLSANRFWPWITEKVLGGETIVISKMTDLPAEANRDRESFIPYGNKSCVYVPLSVGKGLVFGVLAFVVTRYERDWPKRIVQQFQLIAQVFANALARKRTELELVKSEKRLRIITNALPVLIAYVDSNQRYQFNNDAYITWFGIRPAAAFGRSVREVVGDTAYQRIVPYVERALSGEQVNYSQDVVLNDGRTVSLEGIYVPDFDEKKTVRGIYTLVIDVTERNLAQQESKRLQDELVHAGRISTMGELAGALAHEINQPLSAIMSNAQAAKRYLAASTPDLDEVKEILNDIVKEDARASQVINRMRALLKESKMEAEPLDLNSVFGEVVTLVKGEAKRLNIEVELGLDPLLPLVRADRIQLQQVALNLVLNAFDSMNELPHRKRCVQIRTCRQNSQVLAAVEDNGIGLSVGNAEKIFQPFYTTKTKGLGMGLSICRSIILRHQGRIWAENNLDGGTTFYFSLPAAPE